MANFCGKCGTQPAQDARFCAACGANLLGGESAETSSIPSQAAPHSSDAVASESRESVSLAPNQVSEITLSTGDKIRLVTFFVEVLGPRGSGSSGSPQSLPVVNTKKVRVRECDGQEQEYDLSHCEFQIRTGQVLKITQGGSIGSKTHLIMRIENPDTRKCYINPNPDMETIAETTVWTFGGFGRAKDFLKVYALVGGLFTLFTISQVGMLGMVGVLAGLLFGGIVGLVPSLVVYLIAVRFNQTPAGWRRRRLVNEIAKEIRAI